MYTLNNNIISIILDAIKALGFSSMDNSIVLDLDNTFPQYQPGHNIMQENGLSELNSHGNSNISTTSSHLVDSTEPILFQEQEYASNTSAHCNRNMYVSSICNPDGANIEETAFLTEHSSNSSVSSYSIPPNILHIPEQHDDCTSAVTTNACAKNVECISSVSSTPTLYMGNELTYQQLQNSAPFGFDIVKPVR